MSKKTWIAKVLGCGLGLCCMGILHAGFPFHAQEAQAQEHNETRNNVGNEFVSIKGSEAFMRRGPGQHYPKISVYTTAGLPMKILSRLDTWLRVEDWRGQQGWMHRSLLSAKASALVSVPTTVMMTRARLNSRVKAYLERNTVLYVNRCLQEWCYAVHKDARGWVPRVALWGNLYP